MELTGAALVTGTGLTGSAEQKPGLASITVDPASRAGTIRPLHGINNGPICFGGLVDLSARHRELGVPIVRLHDCEWPHPAVVDVPTIFPDFAADAGNPASYRFDKTDDYLQSIVDVGAQIVYRLGTSIEHTRRKYHVHPPPDAGKWADICVHIIRHYNDGWAGGFRHNIRYWEIWNEPDLGALMWSGTFDDYVRLYAATSRAIKAHDVHLKVGGPAVAFPRKPFLADFVGTCRRDNLPLDFCSWHTYTSHPRDLAENARHVRDILDRHGFQRTESHLNEWNCSFDWRNEESRRRSFVVLQGPEGASYCAAVLILLQDSPVDVANYYSGDIQWFGLFDPYGIPRKTFHAFKAFRLLLDTPNRISVQTQGTGDDIRCCAGRSEDGSVLQLLVSNPSREARSCRIQLAAAPADTADLSILATDATHDLSPVRSGKLAGPPFVFEQEVPGHSVQLIRVAKP